MPNDAQRDFQPVDAVRCVNLLARVRVKNAVINLFSKVDPPACEVARLVDLVQNFEIESSDWFKIQVNPNATSSGAALIRGIVKWKQ